ncbi:MAG: ribosomal protein S19 family protein [Nanoarchaeota archaeon]|nr:ribosomal protein S19 family protein [Nanoarchaeota archaeon]
MSDDKIFTFRGKTLDELKALSEEEFVALLPAAARRKYARGLTPAEQLFLDKFRSGKKNIKTHVRELFVLPEMVGQKISIYSGKEFVQVTIMEEMLGLRFGELVPTRKIAQHPDSKK